MAIARDKLSVALAVKRIPEKLCWGKPRDFIENLTQYLTAELDVESRLNLVVVGHETPTEDDKDRLWIRTARDNSFLGFYLFQNGAWKVIHNYRSDEVIWMYGNSTQIPSGFEFIDGSLGGMDSKVQERVISQYLQIEGTNSYSYFAVRWKGY